MGLKTGALVLVLLAVVSADKPPTASPSKHPSNSQLASSTNAYFTSKTLSDKDSEVSSILSIIPKDKLVGKLLRYDDDTASEKVSLLRYFLFFYTRPLYK